MAIEGEKQLAITGGESMAGSGDVKDQKQTDSGLLTNLMENNTLLYVLSMYSSVEEY